MSDERDTPCVLCGGTGFRITEHGACSRARPCECRRATVPAGGLESRLTLARVPQRYASCDFTSYYAYGDHAFPLANAKAKALRYTEEYPLSDRGLLFMGPPGVGKTHLAVATLRKLIADKGIACLFVDVQDLLRRLQATFDRALGMSQLELLQPVLTTEVVALDDLGGRQFSPWVEETLAHIVTTRYNDEKATIVTTNYLDDPPDRRTQTLEDRIGVRVRSRLHEMCHLVLLQAEDFRHAVKLADHHQLTDRIERPKEQT
jgi:DNA replication protein DnaC